MKRLFKWFGYSFAGLIALLTIAIVNVVWFKPFSISVFYEWAFIEFALKNPEMLSSMRLLEQVGLRFHNDDLADISPAHTEELNAKLVDDLATLRSYDRENLEGQTALSYDVLEHFMVQQVDGIKYTWHDYPVNQMYGVHDGMPDFMANNHHIGDARDARDYVTRLSKFGVKFDQLLEDLNLREKKGILPPNFTVVAVLEEMQAFRASDTNENILYTSLVERLDKLENLDFQTSERIKRETADQIDRTVYPAYDKLIAYFDYLKTKATTNHGVWQLPDGDAYYDWQLRGHTTTDLTADEIHRLGLSETARIQKEMDTLLLAEGYTQGSVAQRMTQLGKEARFHYQGSEAGRVAIIAEYQNIIDEIDARMPEYFSILPKSPVEVRPVPKFREEGAAGAYYQGPSMDGSRPGVFYANMRDIEEQVSFGMRTLAYHEAVPGHHFQTSIQTELTGVPQFRRILPFTAFSEGWALYAERLAAEIGFHDDPYSDLGRLQAELFRAVRLVVDTGIHRKRWSREQAIKYMLDSTGMAESEVVAEIERYFVMPGQATAYKVGMLKILELREKAKAALGSDFDLKAFHDVVLRNGDIPLAILEQQVDAYIAATKG